MPSSGAAGKAMSVEGQHLTGGGWTLSVGAASRTVGGTEGQDFHAVYRGEAFGNPRRGLLVAVSRAASDDRAGREAAQIAVHGFAEGYFGATPTLGVGRAAGHALTSTNSWLFSQSRADPQRAGMAASLAAILFASRQIGIIHLGSCRIYRKRQGRLVALTSEHLRPVTGGASVLTRSVGADRDVHADFIDDSPELFDRLVVISQGVHGRLPAPLLAELLTVELSPDQLARRAVEAALAGQENGQATAVVIDILGLPEPKFDDVATAFTALPVRPPPREGDNWDGFIVGRTIYRSRYTLLKRARDSTDNAEVVLKLPLPAMLQDQVFRAGFLREAWIGSSVRSRWVARYIDLPAERRSSLYLVMAYYRGPTLEQRLLARTPVSFAEGIGIALKLCQAVEDLAALQVIHRDIKPENVLVLKNGDIRLLDLGLAYLPGLDDDHEDGLGGTTRYMAPELFKGVAANPRSEVFSLGVTIYRMFSGGEFPFGQHEPYPLARRRPDLPDWLGRALAGAIEMNPDRRTPDASALAAALDHGLLHGAFHAARRLPRISPLRFWQILTCVFAAGFFTLLLLRGHGR